MKKHEIIFSIIKLPLDYVIVFGSFFIAREIRLVTDLIPSISLPIKTIHTSDLLYYAWIGGFLYVFLFTIHWLYNSKISHSKIKEFLDIIQYSLYWFLFFSVWVYFLKWIVINLNNDIPRLIILFTFIISCLLIITGRIILNSIQYYLLQKWYINKKNIAIISNKKKSDIKHILEDILKSKIYTIYWYINKQKNEKIRKNIFKKNENQETIIEKFVWKNTETNTLNKNFQLEYVWWIEALKTLCQEKKIDEILYIDSDYSQEELLEIWEFSKIFWIRYRYLTNSFDITKSNTTLSLINQIPVIEIENTPLWIWWRTLKRLLDTIGSIIWIIIFSPLFIIIGILIKTDEPNAPIFYKNKRIGQDWKIFTLYKFRYIQWKYCIKDAYWIEWRNDPALDYETQLIKKLSKRKWPLYKIKDDPRKTKIGTFIEKYSIDELPQLFNVVLWNMSLVGPRPHQPREVKKYELWEKRVLTIKPWITGMAQVHWRDENIFEDEARMDIFYIENWDLLLDLKIILKTFWTPFNRK